MATFAKRRSRNDTSIPAAKRLPGGYLGDFFPHAFPLRPDQMFSVMFGGAHNRAEFAPATARDAAAAAMFTASRVTDMILPEIGTRFPVRSMRA